MVFFMQAGFVCEAGMTRAKNTGNILMKKPYGSVLEHPVTGW